MKFEQLEARELLAWSVTGGTLEFSGTPGQDIAFLIGSMPQTLVAVNIMSNSVSAMSFNVFTGIQNVSIVSGAGADTFYVGGIGHPVGVDLGEGNDTLFLNPDGAEGTTSVHGTLGGGDDLAYLQKGDDNLHGGAGNDVLIGNDGVDHLFGDEGTDLLIGGSLTDTSQWSVVQSLWNASNFRHQKVVEIIKSGLISGDHVDDVLEGGPGFTLAFDETSPEYDYDLGYTSIISVSTTQELQQVLLTLQPNTRVEIASGEYEVDLSVTASNWSGVSLVGQGEVIVHDLRLNVQAWTAPLLIDNITVDLTGAAPTSSGYWWLRGQDVVVNDLEMYGQGTVNTGSIYFSTGVAPSQYAILNSYIHDMAGDLVSGGGYGATPAVLQGSVIEVFNTVAHTPGPQENNQCLTTHAGLAMAVVGGTYYDAQANVIAPDGQTRLDLYFVTVYAGARQAGVQIKTASTLYGCTFYDQKSLIVSGTVENNTIYTVSNRQYGRFLTTGSDNTVIRKNRVVYCNPGGGTYALSVQHNQVAVIDNVFEDWGLLCIQDLGINTQQQGNLFV